MRYIAILWVFLIVGLIEFNILPSGNGIYTQCLNGQVLKNTTGYWICADDQDTRYNQSWPYIDIIAGNITFNESRANQTIDARVSPYWISLNGNTTTNSSINAGNVHVTNNIFLTGNLSIGATKGLFQNNTAMWLECC